VTETSQSPHRWESKRGNVSQRRKRPAETANKGTRSETAFRCELGLETGAVRPDCEDDPRGVMAEHIVKLRDIFARLDAARTVADMDMPGIRLHPPKGELKGFWAVTVRANWRVISLCRH